MSAAGEQVLLAVTAATKQRPVGLAAMLDSLAALDPPDEPARVLVVVVDNDPAGSARAAVEAYAATEGLPWELRYVHEPAPGIPAARNAAVEASLRWAADVRGGTVLPDEHADEHPLDAVLFLDDDEEVTPGWLRHLLATWRATGADAVTGTVEPTFTEPPEPWVLEGGFYERPRFPTGTELTYARTSNALVAGTVFSGDGLRFASVGMQGGSDSWFFERMHRLGRRIVWCDEAVVTEEVPTSRISARWLVTRHYRYGLVRSAMLRAQHPPVARYAKRTASGLLTVLGGLARLVLGVRSQARRVKAAQQVATGAGLLLGLLGARYDDYRVVHGR